MGKKQLVDQDIATLFSTDFSYGMDKELVKSEAIKRIKRSLPTLDSKTQRITQERLKLYENFEHLTTQEHQKILQYAKMHKVTVEEATRAARN
jgi:hypothetical protein